MPYCFDCGSELIVKIPEMDNQERLVCTNCGYIDYKNPKIITGILPVYNETILLCKRAIEPKKGYWTIPSGFMENGETLQEGALREASEEAGITVETLTLFSLFSISRINQVYVLFLGTLSAPKYTCGPETLEASFFNKDSLPWDDIAFSSVTFALEHYTNDFPGHENAPYIN